MDAVEIKKGRREAVDVNEDGVSNGGEQTIVASIPYQITVEIQGTADLLFHRWNSDAVDAKAKAAKNSAAKKTDDVESYVWRNEHKILCIPGEYLRQSIIGAAKFRQDPRSPRKSAQDLYKAGIVALTNLAVIKHDNYPKGTKDWDYEDRRRVQVQRNGVNRTRPAFRVGWRAEFDILVNLPEYIARQDLISVVNDAGRLIGVADFRPTFGRFVVRGYK